MRLDMFLKTSRLVPRRSVAQEFCDRGLVEVNGAAAKSSKEVKAGDQIAIRRRNRLTRIEIIEIPNTKQVAKASAAELYRVLSDEALADDLLS